MPKSPYKSVEIKVIDLDSASRMNHAPTNSAGRASLFEIMKSGKNARHYAKLAAY